MAPGPQHTGANFSCLPVLQLLEQEELGLGELVVHHPFGDDTSYILLHLVA